MSKVELPVVLREIQLVQSIKVILPVSDRMAHVAVIG